MTLDLARFTLEAFIREMDGHVGEFESPAHSNCCPVCHAYGPIGNVECYPWCCATVAVACQALGFPLRTAAVGQLALYAQQGWNGMWWSSVPVLGGAYCIDWKGRRNWNDMHTGVTYDVLGPARGAVGQQHRGIEGNYQDRCDRWLRDEKYTFGWACFPFTNGPAPAPAPQPIPEGQMLYLMCAREDTLGPEDPVTHQRPPDGVVKGGAVYVLDEDLEIVAQSPNEPWLIDAHSVIHERVLAPTPGATIGTEVSAYWFAKGVGNVWVVPGEFLRPIVA